MKLALLRISLLTFLLAFLQQAQAQCTFTLQMSDFAGDGWNGGSLIVKSGTVSDTVALSNIFGNGADSTITFTVTPNAPLTLTWQSGFYDDEVSFSLYDANGFLLFQISNPTAGQVFTTSAICPSCPKPTNLVNVNIYDTRAKLKWTPVQTPTVGWYVIYGPKGFVPGPGVGDTVFTTQPKITLTGLQKKTEYDWYVVQDCGIGDYSLLVGPEHFYTYWTNDVGICGVKSPVSGCDLGTETLKIQMKNFGSAPQSLIYFNYTVNGVSSAVSQPEDGFYTGVLGKDSCELIEFKAMFDFSAPGEYLIKVFTEMNNDEDMSNDTFYYRIVNRLQAPYHQDFETWEGGWHVDDSLSVFPSWQFGQPTKPLINGAANGINAWVTSLDSHYNLNEKSYLVSPCFDFANLTLDPVIEFAINHQMDDFFEAASLEMSLGADSAWTKVGAIGEGINWYNVTNTFSNLGDVWSGKTAGWVTARHRLQGAKGKSGVRFRFVFNGAPFFLTNSDGLGIDDIKIYVPVSKDLAGLNISTQGEGTPCGLAQDKVTFNFTNFGTQAQAFFKVAYSVNGGAPVIENVTGNVVMPDELVPYTFTTPFDSRDGVFVIKCWPILNGEQKPSNDTVVYTIKHLPLSVPVHEDFETGTLPDNWTTTAIGIVGNGHNNISYAYYYNLYSAATSFTLTSARYGVISANDSLSFDYRITDYLSQGMSGTTLINSKIAVEISSDCGQTFQPIYTINQSNHIVSAEMRTIKVGLSAYANQSIIIRFVGSWVEGDFFFDLDNINILACAANMALTPTVTPATTGNNGAITVKVGVGNPPYHYKWSNGATTQTITGLAVGQYTVTVTDALGCANVLTVNVGTTGTSIPETLNSLNLQPNPTTGILQLKATFGRMVHAQVEVLNLVGQRIWENHVGETENLHETIDLSAYPNGLYLVRLTVDGEAVTRKVVKNQ
ncbi:MAG: T9SS type A sorting domain-containing protein [Bacteroidota bacterium]